MKDDVIYRQDAIDAIKNCTDIYITNLPVMIYKTDAYKALADLPFAQSEQKIGHWIVLDECSNKGVYCSECRKKVFKIDYSNTMKWKNFKFCPNCGADMREKEKWVPIQDPWRGEEDEQRRSD